jgi:hypothetical protein
VGFPVRPPIPPPQGGLPVAFNSVDATQFDTDGTVRFGFSYNGTDIGNRLKIKVTTECIDHSWPIVPWKDCRPSVDVDVLEQYSYYYGEVPVLGVKKVLTFRASLKTRPTKDDECVWAFLTIDVQSGTELLPGVNVGGGVNSIFGNASLAANLTPVLTWTIPFKVCCEDCVEKLTFGPPPDE